MRMRLVKVCGRAVGSLVVPLVVVGSSRRATLRIGKATCSSSSKSSCAHAVNRSPLRGPMHASAPREPPACRRLGASLLVFAPS